MSLFSSPLCPAMDVTGHSVEGKHFRLLLITAPLIVPSLSPHCVPPWLSFITSWVIRLLGSCLSQCLCSHILILFHSVLPSYCICVIPCQSLGWMAFLLPCTRPLMLPGALPTISSLCLQTVAESVPPQTMAGPNGLCSIDGQQCPFGNAALASDFAHCLTQQ